VSHKKKMVALGSQIDEDFLVAHKND